MMDSVRKERMPRLDHMNDMQHGKRMLLLLFDAEVANNNFFHYMNPSGWLMIPTEHNIDHGHVQEVEEGYEPVLPLAFCAVEVPGLRPKSEVLPHSHQVVEEAAVEYGVPQVQ